MQYKAAKISQESIDQLVKYRDTISHYVLIDTKTGEQLGQYSVAQRNRGRNRADKLDLQYGSHRYSCLPIYK